jgi:putative transposase
MTGDPSEKPQPDRKHPHRLSPEEYRLPDQSYFLSFRAQDGANLAQPEVVSRMVKTMRDLGRHWKIEVNCYCFMPDHVHLIVTLAEAGGDLQKWIRYAKRETVKLLSVGKWQRSYWDTSAKEYIDVEAYALYTLYNPVRRGLCERWPDWPYSWSQWHSRPGEP